MMIAILLVSIVLNGYFLARARHYRRRYKEFRRIAHDIAGNGELNIPHLRLGELVPEVGNDRDPAAQPVDLLLPYAGWGNYSGFSDSEYATIARLAKLGGRIALYEVPAEPLMTLLRSNAPAGTEIFHHLSWPPADQPTLIIMSIFGSGRELLETSMQALKAAAPQAMILWHGYRPGVISDALISALAELTRTTALAHLHGTSLLGYRVDLAQERR